AMEVGRRSVQRVTQTGQRFASELVERSVVLKTVDKVSMKTVHTAFADCDVASSHDVRPFHRPESRELIPLQQVVDQLASFVRLFRIKKRSRLFGGRNGADRVEECPPQKHFMSCQFGGQNLKVSLVGKNALVDKVVDRRRSIFELLIRLHACQTCSDDLTKISHQESRFGCSGKLDKTGG
ncbi:MAG: hypothetical protein ACI8P0_006021, partial [Planctomycetaceae bacterium]